MLLSTNTEHLAKCLGDREAISLIARAGFDAFDYTVDIWGDEAPVYGEHYREYAMQLAETARDCQIVCNQAHAHFPSNRWGEEEYNQRAFEKIVRGMEVASLIGARTIVVHPLKSFPEGMSKEEIMERNLEFYGRLLPYCKEFQIKVALENMYGKDKKTKCFIDSACGWGKEFRTYMERVDQDWFVACLDLGHSGLVGDEAWNAIPILGKQYLRALHVHDNDYCKDTHTLPYLGNMDWDKIIKALAEIGYEGDFTYEAANFLKGFPVELLPEASAFMCKVGRYMVKRIEEEMQKGRELI